ncbi:hypothetical protein ABIB82_007734 [Bradyrhizobium sp. i1.8.4]
MASLSGPIGLSESRQVCSERRNTRGTRLVAQQAPGVLFHKAFLPVPEIGLGLTGPVHDLIGAEPSALDKTISARQTYFCDPAQAPPDENDPNDHDKEFPFAYLHTRMQSRLEAQGIQSQI